MTGNEHLMINMLGYISTTDRLIGSFIQGAAQAPLGAAGGSSGAKGWPRSGRGWLRATVFQKLTVLGSAEKF